MNPWQAWREWADDETHWIDAAEPGLLKVEPVHDYVLRLWFGDPVEPTVYELDFGPLLLEHNPGGVFAPLREKARFLQVEGHYALIWPDPTAGDDGPATVDLAPECVRFFCVNLGRRLHSENAATAIR